MTVRMDNTGSALTDERVRQFETDIGKFLPSDFREFLLWHNGGQPTPDVIDIDGLPGGSSDVHVFFGLTRSTDSSNLRWNMREFTGRIRDGSCPIACDSGGNLYCLALMGKDRGAIYYVDLEPEIGAIWYGRPKPQDRCEYKVASSFSEFLSKLREIE